MGKVLVEKLLRDCSNLNRMYLLIRSKKGVDPAQRREEFINHIVHIIITYILFYQIIDFLIL